MDWMFCHFALDMLNYPLVYQSLTFKIYHLVGCITFEVITWIFSFDSAFWGPIIGSVV